MVPSDSHCRKPLADVVIENMRCDEGGKKNIEKITDCNLVAVCCIIFTADKAKLIDVEKGD